MVECFATHNSIQLKVAVSSLFRKRAISIMFTVQTFGKMSSNQIIQR